MSNYPSVPVASFNESAEVKPRNIIKSNARGLPVKGGTLAGGQGVIPAGMVLGRRSDNKYYVYNDAAITGEQVAVAIFLGPFDADTGTAATGTSRDLSVRLATIGFGELFNSAVSGADANAITDLGARVNSVLDSFVL